MIEILRFYLTLIRSLEKILVVVGTSDEWARQERSDVSWKGPMCRAYLLFVSLA